MIVARLAVLIAALVICAGYVLGVRAAHDENRVSALIAHHGSLTASQARNAEQMLSDAKTLNPDLTPDVLAAQVQFRTGDVARAVSSAETVVARAPRDAAAWLILELLTERVDPALNRSAQAHLAALVPPR